ncbi:MAG: conjugal transfer protein TrbF [Bacteroidota bacterium]
MAKELLYATPSYKPEGTPVLSYDRAKKEWDSRIGDARSQAKNWRLCALGLIALCLLQAYIINNISRKSRITPYVVEHNPDGSAAAVGPATEMNFTPQEPEIKYFLGQFVQRTRSLPLDPVVAKNNILAAYKFLDQTGTFKMNQMMKENDPFANLTKETHQVQVNVIVPLSKDTYQVRWREEIYSNTGVLQKKYQMTGLFTINFVPPKTEEEILANPLGLYIKDFSWAPEVQ